jgi:serine/threonine protein kinase
MPPSAPQVLHIAIQVARGLEYLHPTVVHRDLKVRPRAGA